MDSEMLEQKDGLQKEQGEEYIYYNPIWMPDEVSISLFAVRCEEEHNIRMPEDLRRYLFNKYLEICMECREYDGNPEGIYQNFIDDNPEASGSDEMIIECLLDSDKFNYAFNSLKERASAGIPPTYVFSTEDAQSMYDMDFDTLCRYLYENFLSE